MYVYDYMYMIIYIYIYTVDQKWLVFSRILAASPPQRKEPAQETIGVSPVSLWLNAAIGPTFRSNSSNCKASAKAVASLRGHGGKVGM